MDSINDVLDAAKAYCREHTAEATYQYYISDIKAVSFENSNTITLEIRNAFILGIVSDRYTAMLKDAFKSVLGFDVDLVFVTPKKEEEPEKPKLDEKTLPSGRYDFTFENFIKGPSNQFAYAAAQAVAANPSGAYNPLFIYGPSGLGKTHLLNAIQIEIKKNHPDFNIVYVDCEMFTNEIITAVKTATTEQFRQKYRQADVLLIDDIQFWAGKYGVQEAFFHAFNELFSQHKQIVISSDCPAKELTTLEERLRTRFEGGLIADIQPPDAETKIAILKRKALEKKYVVPDDVLAFLVRGSDNNVRTLEGRLNTVIFASKLHEEPISLKLAAEALQEAINSDEQEEVTPDAIIRATCTYFGITKADLIGKNKRQEIVRARQICTYLMCDMLALPLVTVGKIMGGRDHSTIIYARDKVVELMRVNDRVAKDVNDVKSAVLKQ